MHKYLHRYFLHYNEYTDTWAAIPREKINEYNSGPQYPHECWKGTGIIFGKDATLLSKVAEAEEEREKNLDKVRQEHYSQYGWKN